VLFKKKKLTLREIHKLYLLLKPCLPEKEEEFLIDEMDSILDKMTEEVMKQSLEIIYRKEIADEPFEMLILLMSGLSDSDFFNYVAFLKSINGKN
jgi:hypothetical protein